ncbi:MAG: hypothetical protein IJ180_04690 [Bacteroidales bacterium]|nr:hypothetical protein [Bacteroidales bacterium]
MQNNNFLDKMLGLICELDDNVPKEEVQKRIQEIMVSSSTDDTGKRAIVKERLKEIVENGLKDFSVSVYSKQKGKRLDLNNIITKNILLPSILQAIDKDKFCKSFAISEREFNELTKEVINEIKNSNQRG